MKNTILYLHPPPSISCMILLVYSYADAAGLNIRDRLAELVTFRRIIDIPEEVGIKDSEDVEKMEEGTAFSPDPKIPDFAKNPVCRGITSLWVSPELNCAMCGTEGSLLYLDEPHIRFRELVSKLSHEKGVCKSAVDTKSSSADISGQVGQVINREPEMVIFLSRHKSVSNAKTLTVHHVGNFDKAEFGGRRRTLGKSNPPVTTQLLRYLKNEGKHLEYAITFEATHHGPVVSVPATFIEIGSLEMQWKDTEAAKAVAHAVLSVLKDLNGVSAAGINSSPPEWYKYPVLVGIGGGHYCPRFTDVALERKVNFGHIAAGYNENIMDTELLKMMMDYKGHHTAYAGAYIHRKGLSKPRAREIEALCTAAGIRCVSSEEFEIA
ncbi:MAG: D-aminoacyl-tRNA deacylase [Thermoplasmata archaeon]